MGPKLYCIIFTLGLSSMGWAARLSGGESGGGGATALCVEAGVSSVELFDFWEGEHLRRTPLRYFSDQGSFKANVMRAVENLSSQNKPFHYFGEIALKIIGAITDLDDEFHNIPEVILKPKTNHESTTWKVMAYEDSDSESKLIREIPQDAKIPQEVFTGTSCRGGGVARWHDSNNGYEVLGIYRPDYAKMRRLHRAGLFVHEAIYKYLRMDFQVADAIAARQFTACAFAIGQCPELDPEFGLPTRDKWLECKTQEAESPKTFYVFAVEGKWRFQMMKVGLYSPIQRSYFELNADKVRIERKTSLVVAKEFEENQVTKSCDNCDAENTYQNIGVHQRLRIEGRTATRELAINGYSLKCGTDLANGLH